MIELPQLYLASRSPRRAELLRQLGLRFESLPAEVPEIPGDGEAPAAYALRLAVAKALAAQRYAPDPTLPVLGADTDVVLDGRILGKPTERGEGMAMLLALAHRSHEVYSAVAMVQGERVESRLSVSRVSFGPITQAQAAAYWASGEPADKAGGYGIQGLGAAFVREIQGSYSGVVGLPLYETVTLLREFGIDILDAAPPA